MKDAGGEAGVDEAGGLRAHGERIEHLLEASAAFGPVAHERAEELVRLVVDLYGAGLERVLEIAYDAGKLDDDMLAALAADDLVASLLLVHGLHPHGVTERVEQALVNVRPYLGSHGGDVELISVSDEGVVTLRMLGSCDGCASSSVTLKLAVEGAIEAAAPEVISIEVETPSADAAAKSGIISVESLSARLRAPAVDVAGGASWAVVPGFDQMPAGVAAGVEVAGLDVIICKVGTTTYAYQAPCGACGASLAGAAIERLLGSGRRSAVLTCPACRGHFSVQEAGKGLDDPDVHLDPLPLLERDGVIEIAVPSGVSA